MNEKELQEFNRKYAKLKQEIKDTPEKTTPRVLWRIYLAITSYSPVVADIARQLTRIANQGEPKDKLEMRELARHQSCGCILCFCYGDRCRDCGAKNCGKNDCVLKTSKGVVYADDSAPDALVEAAKELAHIVDNFIADYRTRYPEITTRIDSFTTKPVLDALAAATKEKS